jgi:ABC-2 type transport system permease protein
MRMVAHATPHAWAMDGFRAVSAEGATVGGVVTELVVLLDFAVALVLAGVWLFRRALIRAQ